MIGSDMLMGFDSYMSYVLGTLKKKAYQRGKKALL